MVEFAIIGPLLFLLLLGLIVLGIVVMNQIQLTNAVRDGARAAAVCGSSVNNTNTARTLPDGTTKCTTSAVLSYLSSQVNAVHGGVSTPSVTVIDTGGTTKGSGDTTKCQPGYLVRVTASFSQPLYLPLIGNLLGNGGSRQLSARAEAQCEQ